MNPLDTGGGERFYNFSHFVNEKVQQAKSENNPKNNVYDLFNPSSPTYLGKYVSQFKSGSQGMSRDIATKINQSFDKNKQRKPLDDILKGSKP